MSELTPERIRDAAEVLASYVLITDPIEHKNTHRVGVSANMLLKYAELVERQAVEDAKREKRAAELAVELRDLYSDHSWRHLADVLLTRYPALADGPEL